MPGAETPTIREAILRELSEAGSAIQVVAVGQVGGFSVVAACGASECPRQLINSRGETRMFSNLTTLAAFLKRIGVERFSVDASAFSEGRIRSARPDRAEAMRATRTRMKQASLEF